MRVCDAASMATTEPPSPPLPSLKAQGSRLKASTRDSRRRGCQDPAVRRGRRGGWWARLHRDRLAREMASSLTAVTRGQAWWLHQTARRTLKWPLLWALARYAQHADARNAGHRALHSTVPTYVYTMLCLRSAALLRAGRPPQGEGPPLTMAQLLVMSRPAERPIGLLMDASQGNAAAAQRPCPSAPRPGRRRRDASSIRVQQPCPRREWAHAFHLDCTAADSPPALSATHRVLSSLRRRTQFPQSRILYCRCTHCSCWCGGPLMTTLSELISA